MTSRKIESLTGRSWCLHTDRAEKWGDERESFGRTCPGKLIISMLVRLDASFVTLTFGFISLLHHNSAATSQTEPSNLSLRRPIPIDDDCPRLCLALADCNCDAQAGLPPSILERERARVKYRVESHLRDHQDGEPLSTGGRGGRSLRR